MRSQTSKVRGWNRLPKRHGIRDGRAGRTGDDANINRGIGLV